MMIISKESTDILDGLLSSAQNPVIVSHMKPDGDAIGSCMGMYHLLRKTYRSDVRVALANPAPWYLDFLIRADVSEDIYIYEHRPEQTRDIIMNSDLIICLDFNALHRTDTLQGILEEAPAKKVLIDHHLFPETNRFSLVFSFPESSSTCELEYHILKMLSPVQGDAMNMPEDQRLF